MTTITNAWWHRQLTESMKEASKLIECYRLSPEPNIDYLDRAITLYEECCEAYRLEQIDFDEFVDFGKSLRARQAHKITRKDHTYE